MLNIIRNIYLSPRFFGVLSLVMVSFLVGFFYPIVYAAGKAVLLFFIALSISDIFLLFRYPSGVLAHRKMSQRFSNGDPNSILIEIQNQYPFKAKLAVIDEIPVQFQIRDFWHVITLRTGDKDCIRYSLTPKERGEFHFGSLLLYASSPLGIIRRRFQFNQNAAVKVYPSFIEMRKYELLAISNRLTEAGVRKIRRISHNSEFEQIREYVQGDDLRTLNWKATARRSQLMVNQYQDEKSQEIYSFIDMGRSMQMPFEGMSLLNYSINSSLIISDVALLKSDKAGLLCFSKDIQSFLPADSKKMQMQQIMERLYNVETEHLESDYEKVFVATKKFIRKRSLLILYTNFEGISSMRRQLAFFKALSKTHLLVVVFFKNTAIQKILLQKPNNLEEIYVKTIAEKVEFEKRQIVKELNQHGIHSVLSEPNKLNVNVINKYLELKAVNLI